MRPAAIEERLKLRQPIYSETAAYGHMGRTNEVVSKTFFTPDNQSKTLEVELFTWENWIMWIGWRKRLGCSLRIDSFVSF